MHVIHLSHGESLATHIIILNEVAHPERRRAPDPACARSGMGRSTCRCLGRLRRSPLSRIPYIPICTDANMSAASRDTTQNQAFARARPFSILITIQCRDLLSISNSISSSELPAKRSFVRHSRCSRSKRWELGHPERRVLGRPSYLIFAQ
jgi:hypothetical protein